MNFNQAMEEYLSWLVLFKWKSEKTQEQYTRHLHKLRDYLIWKKLENIDVEKITLESVNEFRLKLFKNEIPKRIINKEWKEEFIIPKSRWISQKTVNAYMISIRSFFSYLVKKDLDVVAPAKIDLSKEPQREVEFLTENELRMFFDSFDRETLVWKRDYAIVKMIYVTGLRISELTALNKIDVNRELEQFTIRWKWWKLRIIFLNSDLIEALDDYENSRTDHFSALFIRHNFSSENIWKYNNENTRLSRFFITKMIKSRAMQAWIIKKVTAHTIRHSFATTLLWAGADLRSIQELLWHSNISTTQVYTHVTNKALKEVHKKFMK